MRCVRLSKFVPIFLGFSSRWLQTELVMRKLWAGLKHLYLPSMLLGQMGLGAMRLKREIYRATQEQTYALHPHRLHRLLRDGCS